MKTMPEIKYAVQTDLGRIRKNNEDNYIFYVSADRNWLILGVIDGVGGYEGGEVAAFICKEQIEKQAGVIGDTVLSNPEAYLKQMLTTANNVIYRERQNKPALSQMSCVVSFALLDIRTELLFYAHVGDTRGYLFRNDELIKFTHDHSVVGYLEDSGAILEADALSHPRRNEILKMLGEKNLTADDNEFIEIGSHSFYSGDIALFCSDGLTDLVDKSSISAILQEQISLDDKVKQLITTANKLGGKDNITVALASYSIAQIYEKEELEETVLENASEPVQTKKTMKKYLQNMLWFLLGALTMYLATLIFPMNKTTKIPNNDINISIDSLRTNPFPSDSLAKDSLRKDSLHKDSIKTKNIKSVRHAK